MENKSSFVYDECVTFKNLLDDLLQDRSKLNEELFELQQSSGRFLNFNSDDSEDDSYSEGTTLFSFNFDRECLEKRLKSLEDKIKEKNCQLSLLDEKASRYLALVTSRRTVLATAAECKSSEVTAGPDSTLAVFLDSNITVDQGYKQDKLSLDVEGEACQSKCSDAVQTAEQNVPTADVEAKNCPVESHVVVGIAFEQTATDNLDSVEEKLGSTKDVALVSDEQQGCESTDDSSQNSNLSNGADQVSLEVGVNTNILEINSKSDVKEESNVLEQCNEAVVAYSEVVEARTVDAIDSYANALSNVPDLKPSHDAFKSVSDEEMRSLSDLVRELRKVKDEMGSCISRRDVSFRDIENDLETSRTTQKCLLEEVAELKKLVNQNDPKSVVNETHSDVSNVMESSSNQNKCSLFENIIAQKEIGATTDEEDSILAAARDAEITCSAVEATDLKLTEDKCAEKSSGDESLLKAQNIELKEKLRSSSGYLKCLAKDREKKQDECNFIQGKVQGVEGKMSTLQKMFDTLFSAVMTERDNLVKENETKCDVILELNQKVVSLQKLNVQIKENVALANNKKLNDLTNMLEVKKGENENLRLVHEDKVRELSVKLDDVKSICNKLEHTNNDSLVKVRILSQLVEQKDGQIGDLNSKNQAKVDELNVKLHDTETDLKNTNEEVSAINARHLSEIQLLQDQIKGADVEKLRIDFSEVVNKLSVKEEECKELEAKMEHLNEDMNKFTNCLKEEVSRMKEDMMKQSEARLDLEVRYDTLSEDHQDLYLQKKRLENNESALSDLLEEQKAVTNDLYEKLQMITTKYGVMFSAIQQKEDGFTEELRVREATIRELKVTLKNNDKQSHQNYRALQDDMNLVQLKMLKDIKEYKQMIQKLQTDQSNGTSGSGNLNIEEIGASLQQSQIITAADTQYDPSEDELVQAGAIVVEALFRDEFVEDDLMTALDDNELNDYEVFSVHNPTYITCETIRSNQTDDGCTEKYENTTEVYPTANGSSSMETTLEIIQTEDESNNFVEFREQPNSDEATPNEEAVNGASAEEFCVENVVAQATSFIYVPEAQCSASQSFGEPSVQASMNVGSNGNEATASAVQQDNLNDLVKSDKKVTQCQEYEAIFEDEITDDDVFEAANPTSQKVVADVSSEKKVVVRKEDVSETVAVCLATQNESKSADANEEKVESNGAETVEPSCTLAGNSYGHKDLDNASDQFEAPAPCNPDVESSTLAVDGSKPLQGKANNITLSLVSSASVEELERELSYTKHKIVTCISRGGNITDLQGDIADTHQPTEIAPIVRRVEQLSGLLAVARFKQGRHVDSVDALGSGALVACGGTVGTYGGEINNESNSGSGYQGIGVSADQSNGETVCSNDLVLSVETASGKANAGGRSLAEEAHYGDVSGTLVGATSSVVVDDPAERVGQYKFKSQGSFEKFLSEKQSEICEFENKLSCLNEVTTFEHDSAAVVSQEETLDVFGYKAKTFEDHLKVLHDLKKDVIGLKIVLNGLETQRSVTEDETEKTLTDIESKITISSETESANGDLELKKNFNERLKSILSVIERKDTANNKLKDCAYACHLDDLEVLFLDSVAVLEKSFDLNIISIKDLVATVDDTSCSSTYEIRIKHLEIESKAMAEKLKSNEHKVGVLNEVKKKLVSYSKSLEDKIHGVDKKAARAEIDSEALVKVNEQLEDKIAGLMNRIDALMVDKSALEYRLMQSESELTANMKQVNHLKCEKETLDWNLQYSQDERKEFETKLLASDQRAAEMNSRLESCDKGFSALKEVISDLRKAISLLEDEKCALDKARRELEEKFSHKENELNSVKLLNTTLIEESSNYEGRIRVLLDENNKLRLEAVNRECEVKTANIKVKQLELQTVIQDSGSSDIVLKEKLNCALKENIFMTTSFKEEQSRMIEMQNSMVEDLEKIILSLEADKKDLNERLNSLQKKCALTEDKNLNISMELEKTTSLLDSSRRRLLQFEHLEPNKSSEACTSNDKKAVSSESKLQQSPSDSFKMVELEAKMETLRKEMAVEIDLVESRKDEETEQLVEKLRFLEEKFGCQLAEMKEFYETILLEEKAEFGRVLVSKVSEYDRHMAEKCDEISGWETKLMSMQEELDDKMIVIDELEGRLECRYEEEEEEGEGANASLERDLKMCLTDVLSNCTSGYTEDANKHENPGASYGCGQSDLSSPPNNNKSSMQDTSCGVVLSTKENNSSSHDKSHPISPILGSEPALSSSTYFESENLPLWHPSKSSCTSPLPSVLPEDYTNRIAADTSVLSNRPTTSSPTSNKPILSLVMTVEDTAATQPPSTEPPL